MISQNFTQPKIDFEKIQDVYISWKKKGMHWRGMRSMFGLKSVTVTPSEQTEDGQVVDLAEKSKVFCPRNNRIIEYDRIQLFPCDKN